MKPVKSILILAALLVAHTVGGATHTVTSLADSGAGSLRAALATATNGDTINFSLPLPATIILTTGQLLIDKSIAIVGPGPTKLAINGNQLSRVFWIHPSNTVSISGLAMINGVGAFGGGGIYNDRSALTVSNCAVSRNRSGGIANIGQFGGSALLKIVNSTISSNATAQGGGGILNNGGGGHATMTVSNCTINDNVASDGGGILSSGAGGDAVLLVQNCTLSGNSATNGDGGAIYNNGSSGSALLQIQHCTFSSNLATSEGGVHSTIHNNPATLEIGNTILHTLPSMESIANNSGGAVISHGYNIASDGLGAGGGTGPGGVLSASTDRRNTDPLLDPAGLKDNGGPTPTIALQAGGPAIDAGNTSSLDQAQIASTGLAGSLDQWQSFTAARAGLLTRIALSVGSPAAPAISSGTIRIYAGEGTNGALLSTASITIKAPIGFQTFALSPATEVIAGSQYTIRLSVLSVTVGWLEINGSNPYAGGRASTDPSWDFLFKTYVTSEWTTDQRGEPRPFDNPGVANRAGSDGSDIGACESSVRITAAEKLGSDLRLSFTSVLGRNHELQSRALAGSGTWSSLPDSVTGSGGIVQSTITNAFTQANQFYRVHELP